MIVSSIKLSHQAEKSDQVVQALSFNLGYRAELDGFRGICIILVLVHHFYHPFLPGGFLGVDMFFVLSGFLITSLLIQEWHKYDTINLKNFYIRRLFRLMPAVVFLVLILTIYAFFFLEKDLADKTFQGIWLTLSYVSNWFYAFNVVSADNALGVTWSLAIEEQFYLIFPIVLSLALKFKMSRRHIIWTLIILIGGVAFNRKILADYGAATQRLYYASDTRADALLIGCLVAFLFSWNFSLIKRFESHFKIAAVISSVFLLLMFSTADWSDAILYQGGYTFVALAVAALLIALVAYQPKTIVKVLSFSPLVWIGRVSYGLYLWHWTVRYFLYDQQILPSSNLQLLAAIILSFALTVLSFYAVEKPFLRLKNLFSNTRNAINA